MAKKSFQEGDGGSSFDGYAAWWRSGIDSRFFTFIQRDVWSPTGDFFNGRAVVDDFGNLVRVA